MFIARQADSPESLEFPIRANRANRFARITPRIPQSGHKSGQNRVHIRSRQRGSAGGSVPEGQVWLEHPAAPRKISDNKICKFKRTCLEEGKVP